MSIHSEMTKHIQSILDYSKYLVQCDETELALKLLDTVPAFYRDNKIKKFEDLKCLINSRITITHDLLSDDREFPKDKEWCIKYLNETMRGHVLKTDFKEANRNGITPTIVDFGPGDFCFPIALNELGFKFNYKPYSLNKDAVLRCKDILGDKVINKINSKNPIWFVAYEIIEHLHNIEEIKHVHDRNGPADKIFLSTPKYTYGTGTVYWESDGIHHLRAYTPNEFVQASCKMFSDYKFDYYDNEVMTLVGVRK